jgi:hypothetical protein
VAIAVSTNWSVNQVAKSQEIREPVRFDCVPVLEQWRVHRLFRCVEIAAEMPLPLIGSVIAEFPQTIPDRHHVRGHVALPGSLHVVEDAGMLNVLPCVNDGARRLTSRAA